MTESFPLIEEVSRERLRKLDPLLTHLSLLSVNCRYDFLVQDFYFRLRIEALFPIYLHLIFTNFCMNLIFGLFQSGILQATKAVNIKFKLRKNQFYLTQYFKQEFYKNQVQMKKGLATLAAEILDKWKSYLSLKA